MRIGIAVQKRVLELCRENGITVNKLATLSGLTQSTLNNIVSGRNQSATVTTVQKICDGIGISVRDFFESSLFDDIEQELR